jgi:hypothetical protein
MVGGAERTGRVVHASFAALAPRNGARTAQRVNLLIGRDVIGRALPAFFDSTGAAKIDVYKGFVDRCQQTN